ncbi:aldo/keto reductase [Caballeronia sp. DA-9]|uniref:aldo/keto reductase n=1 Tax=Caballeronia sp. DA-9 TaxID=3436237 RepID=UPI003F672E33
MRYRPLGGSGLQISAVGFGTCQLRMIPHQQAIDTLKRGFDLGVNFVHTAPDYEGAEDLVAQAVKESGRKVLVFTQGYGAISHFEWLFEMACRRAGTSTLDVFGIACVEDRESLNENVWGAGGMIEFLLEKKREGRLRSIFAESHGAPEYIKRLIQSKVFDSILLAYNTLGFHALSYYPEPPATFETLSRNKLEIFPLAREHGVSILLMKSLGGGLLCKGKAFAPHARFSTEEQTPTAGDVLRHLLLDPDITAVVPGTASVEEAEENAKAGFTKPPFGPEQARQVEASSAQMQQTLCTRCGHCDSLCSHNLPVSWLFRDAYVSTIAAETFETLDRLQYFHLHPGEVSTCSTCNDVTCKCPSGLDIKHSLTLVHSVMLDIRKKGLLPLTPAQSALQQPRGPWRVRLFQTEVPDALARGQSRTCRLWCENAGEKKWIPASGWTNGRGLILSARIGGVHQTVPLRHEVEPHTRTHFTFEIKAPAQPGNHHLEVFLRSVGDAISPMPEEDIAICSFPVDVK